MRVFFIGSVIFSRSMLEVVLKSNQVALVGIATKSASSFNTDHDDLSDLASLNSIPYKYVKDINAAHIETWIKSLQPDLIFCLGWSSLIKKNILNIPKEGVVGYHPAKLPYNRGRHPLIWAKVLGLKETASTFFLMDEGADSGDIVSQVSIPIQFEDRAADLYQKMIETAKQQLSNLLNAFVNGEVEKKPQLTEGNSWRKRGVKDGEIDFRMSSRSLVNLVRALSTPYPGAHCFYQGAEVKVWDAQIAEFELPNIEPGKVLEAKGKAILVKTGDSAVWLLEHNLVELPEKGAYMND